MASKIIEPEHPSSTLEPEGDTAKALEEKKDLLDLRHKR